MKKLLFLLMAGFFVLSACGNSEDSKDSEMKASEPKKEKPEEDKKDKSLEDKTAKLDDVNVEILNAEYLPKGTYEYQESPQLAVEYEVKNKSDKEITPLTGWFAAFEATQDGEDTVRKLDVGMTPNTDKYQSYVDTQSDNIKKDGTAKGAVALDLKDTETPVVLTAHKGVGGEELGQVKINISK
ncbi:DUF5067 domain-containing protein [Staphylococcus equorum]|uniref:DUF5067 domain-containing protein n=2 Tax=Staphylococcus equorum TaxID=246432 RepID=A0A9X4L4H0_9STAP|nr:DUF5067 domain-containing protein [Staphylococcus equorum]ALM56688.1 hypothetical protein SE1039_09050 [Staphylococcus equorum]MDG0819936.1 DUF5067 domain-containing protein [Staphylococcus equorum]MDG0840791.1 DUF5067 domain-containing protein [Staphylococcus equorum]MDG0846260.1 DUF5067 domain-containing protein [Staphylococcus equorum]OEL08555.1 hypothetical protein AST04_06315 [Staphylococcus equorum]